MSTFGFYRNLVPLNPAQHKNLTLKSSATGFKFAQQAVSVPLAGVEFADAALEFPIVFIPAADEGMVPVAVLGLKPDANLFVDAQGAWRAHYVPAFLRRYPFIPAQDTPQSEPTVWMDEAYDGLNAPDGELLIDAEGNKTPRLDDILGFLLNCQSEYARTRAWAKVLSTLNLLKPLTATVANASGEQFHLSGFQVVDEEKLGAIDDKEVMRLLRSGAMAWIYAHLLSIRNLRKLAEMGK